MGIKFKIDVEEGIIYSIGEGTVTAEDVHTHRKNLRADPNFSPSLAHIMEFRMSSFSISDEESKALAAALPVDHTRKTALVSIEPYKRWAVWYRELIMDRIQVEIFEDLGSAKEWIASD